MGQETDADRAGSIRQSVSRRHVLTGIAGTSIVAASARAAGAGAGAEGAVDLAAVARPTASGLSGVSSLDAILRPTTPASSADVPAGMWNVWANHKAQWVELAWPEPVSVDRAALYWGADRQEIAPPAAARILWWDGGRFVPVVADGTLGTAADAFNTLTFKPVRTARLRLELEPQKGRSVAVMRWRAMAAGAAPTLPAAVDAGIDRSVVVGATTYLDARAAWVGRGPGDTLRWTKASGPGEVLFADPQAATTTARFSRAGDYELRLTVMAAGRPSVSSLRVRAVAPPPERRLDVVYTTPYSIDSPLWTARAKALIVNWIPHCIAYCERTDLPTGAGGLDNFIEAGRALRGQSHARHKGYVFSNAWVHQTVESMCLALMVDPQGDPEIAAAHDHMHATLARWIPIILAAQEPDGYLQTAYTLADRAEWPRRWSPEHRANHEGYVAGYFIESAINHHTLTGGRDLRLYDAAKRLADCWVANIGPDRKPWFDGHQEMEQALVRFGRFVNDVEGGGRGDAYVRLAKFLLDSREGGTRYDQSHLPAVRQYEAVGHAVRAMYFYSGMADIAAETNDPAYQSAVASLWDNMVNRKYYVTGGVGSGDTSEGFGADYGLRQDGYCESCSSCGLIFLQYKMNLAYHDAKYADLYEETMYNALLGGVAMDGRSFCYTNPLVNTERAKWHSCPCCVANISRTLLMLPTWAYAKRDDALYVNLFIGSRADVGTVGGVPVEVVQRTSYPWQGGVEIVVNPKQAARFTVHVRAPDRATSALYTATPAVRGLRNVTVNGAAVPVRHGHGYVAIEREWAPGDTIAFDVPMAVQRVRGSEAVAATRGLTALRYGPLVYSVERADQPDIDLAIGAAPISATWRPDVMGGVVTLDGRWRDGTPLRAVPYYTRMNRTGRPVREFPAADGAFDPAIGVVEAADDGPVLSRVWLAT